MESQEVLSLCSKTGAKVKQTILQKTFFFLKGSINSFIDEAARLWSTKQIKTVATGKDWNRKVRKKSRLEAGIVWLTTDKPHFTPDEDN